MIRYEARLAFGMASLLPLLFLPGYMLFGAVIWLSRQQTPPLHEIRTAFELLLTLSGGLVAAHLMTIEREEGFDELRRTYPEKSWRVPLLRTGVAVMFIVASALTAALILYLLHGEYAFTDMVMAAFPPAFYLCGLALLVNNISGSYWLAAGVVGGYWFGDLMTGGAFTGILFLFNNTMPVVDAAMNRGVLLAAAILFFAANTGFSLWRRRGGG